jgi:hypothetical protein
VAEPLDKPAEAGEKNSAAAVTARKQAAIHLDASIVMAHAKKKGK